MTETLIWAVVALAPPMTAVLWLAPAARRAIVTWTEAHAASAAEREAAVQGQLAGIAERRHALAVKEAARDQEVAAERASLEAYQAQCETDAEAARRTLPDAVTARQAVLAARADAEAALAPAGARKALEGSDAEALEPLGEAYETYCQEYKGAQPLTFGQWIKGFDGLRRG